MKWTQSEDGQVTELPPKVSWDKKNKYSRWRNDGKGRVKIGGDDIPIGSGDLVQFFGSRHVYRVDGLGKSWTKNGRAYRYVYIDSEAIDERDPITETITFRVSPDLFQSHGSVIHHPDHGLLRVVDHDRWMDGGPQNLTTCVEADPDDPDAQKLRRLMDRDDLVETIKDGTKVRQHPQQKTPPDRTPDGDRFMCPDLYEDAIRSCYIEDDRIWYDEKVSHHITTSTSWWVPYDDEIAQRVRDLFVPDDEYFDRTS